MTQRPWPDPTPEMLDDPRFKAIWLVIKTWDIGVPDVYAGYCGATGNHARAILDALDALRGRRVPVQANRQLGKPSGTVAWDEHVKAWCAYAARYGESQSAERLAQRGGFCYGELVDFLGHPPTTWEPRT